MDSSVEALTAAVEAQSAKVRDLKAAKATKEAITTEVNELLKLKVEYKAKTGTDFPSVSSAPAPTAPAEKSAKKAKPEETKKDVKEKPSTARKEEKAAPPPKEIPVGSATFAHILNHSLYLTCLSHIEKAQFSCPRQT